MLGYNPKFPNTTTKHARLRVQLRCSKNEPIQHPAHQNLQKLPAVHVSKPIFVLSLENKFLYPLSNDCCKN